MKRDIKTVLYFRQDISPFLVHLTRNNSDSNLSASEVLKKVIQDRQLVCGQTCISDAKYGMSRKDFQSLTDEEKKRLFSAICFTETPLNEIYCLFEISYRSIHLARYGLVFLKDKLAEKGVSPVLYINNECGDKDEVFQALCSLAQTQSQSAYKVLPLVSVFGQKICRPGDRYEPPPGSVDFRWEREWRYPYNEGPLEFDENDVFVGLCPNEEIDEFEKLFPDVKFIDPIRNTKWYATKLVESRKRFPDFKYSVV